MSKYELDMQREKRLTWMWISICMGIVISVIVALMAILPSYRVWAQEKRGQAELARAEYNKRIIVEEAKATLEAEILNAQAEVERAKGAAQAIEIEDGRLTPQYIQYLWVRQQNNLNNRTVIYIPTETNLPILEASRELK